jgi:isopentenyl-diphosphate delta-isomerase
MNPTGTSVSHASENLILVSPEDEFLGTTTKQEAHRPGGQLHRAFSVFLFSHEGQVLLHERSRLKPLWPGYWTNSCCSHPRHGESYIEAAHRRTGEELGVQTSLTEIYQFEYQAHFKGIGSEHELCKVYVGSVSSDTQIHPHPEEIQTWDWFEVSEVNEWMTTSPQLFTPWFLMEWKALQTTYQSTLREALRPPEPNPAH